MGVFGTVFSIEEFSIFDGDGIRTTVFLKGCPLRCEWCHSPEGQSAVPEYLRTPNGCLGCGACERVADRRDSQLIYNAQSAALCPRQCIRLCGERYDSEALVARLERNIPLLNQSGGGVTFSGGEALSQSEFLYDCLCRLKGKTHRMLQSCGYASTDCFQKVLTELDGVLYDLKLLDNAQHKRYTGVSNELILQNFGILVQSGVPFTVRVPLIPTVTDTEKNLRALCEFLRHHGVTYAELMPYHAMTGSKYSLCGRVYAPSFDESVKPCPRTELFAAYGIQVKIL